VRRAIVAESLDANTLYRMGVHPGTGMGRRGPAPEESPVFGVIDIKGEIICDVVAAYDAATILHYKSNFRLQTGSGGGVYTAPIRKYRSLVGCGPAFWPTRLVRHDASRLAVDSLPFWTCAKELFVKQRGVTAEAFPLILKEAEFRYNHRNQALLDTLAPLGCRRIPRPVSHPPDADAYGEHRTL
jgi:transposase